MLRIFSDPPDQSESEQNYSQSTEVNQQQEQLTFNARYEEGLTHLIQQCPQLLKSLCHGFIRCQSQEKQITAFLPFQHNQTMSTSSVLAVLEQTIQDQLKCPHVLKIASTVQAYRDIESKHHFAGIPACVIETTYQVRDKNGQKIITLVSFGTNYRQRLAEWKHTHKFKLRKQWIDATRRGRMLTEFTEIVDFYSVVFDALEKAFQCLAKSLREKNFYLSYDCFRNYIRGWHESVYPLKRRPAVSNTTIQISSFQQLNIHCRYLLNLSTIAGRVPNLIKNHTLSLCCRDQLLFSMNKFWQRVILLRNKTPQQRLPRQQITKQLCQFLRGENIYFEVLLDRPKYICILTHICDRIKMSGTIISRRDKEEVLIKGCFKIGRWIVQLRLITFRVGCVEAMNVNKQ